MSVPRLKSGIPIPIPSRAIRQTRYAVMARWPWLLTCEEPAKDKRIECTSALCGICDRETTNGFKLENTGNGHAIVRDGRVRPRSPKIAKILERMAEAWVHVAKADDDASREAAQELERPLPN